MDVKLVVMDRIGDVNKIGELGAGGLVRWREG
jgi:hypothetical protein